MLCARQFKEANVPLINCCGPQKKTTETSQISENKTKSRDEINTTVLES